MAAYKDTERNTWYVAFYYRDWQGNNKKKKKRGFKTKREALEWEQGFKQKQAASLDMLFKDFVEVYTEDMTPNPVSAYGRTKLVGEENAKKAEKYYILRTAWLYGLGGKNFVKTMLNLSKDRDEISVVDDQHGSPTSTTTLCEIIEQIMEKEPAYGIYHSTNEGFTTWCKFTRKIFEIAGIQTNVKAITSKEYKEMYPQSSDRPTNSQLSKEKLKNVGIVPSKWEDALSNYLKEELK